MRRRDCLASAAPGLWAALTLSRPQPVVAQPGAAAGSGDAVRKVAGSQHFLALMADGSVVGWGNSDWGQIGAGVDADSQLKAVTPKIGGVARVWAGGNNSFALTRDGRFWAWGASQEGTGLLGTQSKVPTAWPMSFLQPA
jgi:alpha-tubulin suppressor-like RCC1 family protein